MSKQDRPRKASSLFMETRRLNYVIGSMPIKIINKRKSTPRKAKLWDSFVQTNLWIDIKYPRNIK